MFFESGDGMKFLLFLAVTQGTDTSGVSGSTSNIICGGADVLRVLQFIRMLMDILFIIVPIGLILMISVDFFKSVIASNGEDMAKNGRIVLKRIINCVALFLVKPIVAFVITFVGDYGVNPLTCLDIAMNDDLSLYEVDFIDEDYESVPVNLSTPSLLIPSDSQNSSASAKAFLESLERMSTEVEKAAAEGHKWLYSNSKTKNTFEKAASSNEPSTNCALYVNWALIDIGVMESGERFYKCYDACGYENKINYRKTNKAQLSEKIEFIDAGNKTAKSLIEDGTLKAGDIVLWYNHQHTNVYAGEGKWYDAGRQGGATGSGSSNNFRFTTLGPVKLGGWMNEKVWQIMRVK